MPVDVESRESHAHLPLTSAEKADLERYESTIAANTRWLFNERGFMTNKAYADNLGPSYSYTAGGRLSTRTWARGVVTAYTPNNAGEVGTVILLHGGMVYDSLGQVTSGKKYWSDASVVAGQQFDYSYDDIGNRELAKTGGDSTGSNLRTSTYTANALNQYDQRTVYGSLNVLGAATKCCGK